MKNFYKFTAYIFLFSVLGFSALLFLFQNNIMYYLTNLTVRNNSDLDISLLMAKSNETNDNFGLINPDDLFNNPKFKKLAKTKVDLTGLNIPNPNVKPETASTTEPMPNFEVGNHNPFLPF